MITDLNCVDCEIHVIKLDVVLTNFTVLWGRIFSILPSLVFVIELSADAGLSSYIGNVLRLVLVFQLLLLVCWKRHIPYIPFLWPSFSFSSFLRSIFPSFLPGCSSPPLPPYQMSRILVYGHIACSFKRLVPNLLKKANTMFCYFA